MAASASAARPGGGGDPRLRRWRLRLAATIALVAAGAFVVASACGGSGSSGNGGTVGTTSIDGGTTQATCVAPATQGSCTNSAFPLTCGGSACCPTSSPFYCATVNACFKTSAEAVAACGNTACIGCTLAGAVNADGGTTGGGGTDGGSDGGTDGGTSGGACAPAPTQANAACNAQFPVDCGGGFCCPANLPFACEATNRCYPTQAEAQAACGNSCQACRQFIGTSTDGGTGGGTDGGAAATCAPPPTRPSGLSQQQCPKLCNIQGNNISCCPANLPFACASTGKCYSTQAEATAACGNTCWSCQ